MGCGGSAGGVRWSHRHDVERDNMNIKVQYADKISIVAVMNSGIENAESHVLTFHAYSDTMKARVLEDIARGVKVNVFLTDDEPHAGEWLEKPL